jgi:hypothetical protein
MWFRAPARERPWTKGERGTQPRTTSVGLVPGPPSRTASTAQTDLTVLLSVSAILYIDFDSLLNKKTKQNKKTLVICPPRFQVGCPKSSPL